MADILGLELKKFIEFCLSLALLIFQVIEKYPYTSEFYMIVLCFAYLALLLLMSLAGRGLGAATPLEAVFGVMLTVFGILNLHTSLSPLIRALYVIFELILGLMLIIFMLF